MTIIEQAAAALARTRATTAADAGQTSPVDAAHLRRALTAIARDVSAMLGVPPTDVVVTADPLRGYGDVPGVLITVHDSGPVHHGGDGPPDPPRAWRFVPEVGNTGTGGGAYLLLDPCAACGAEVPMAAISTLADLGLYVEQAGPRSPDAPDPDDEDGHRPEVPIEFFDDPGHAPGCPSA